MEMNHECYMRQTIALAADVPERPFAALIADRVTGNVIAEGRNQSDKNPTWHGEIDAINRLAADVPGIDYSNAFSTRRLNHARCVRAQYSGLELGLLFSGPPSAS